MTGEELAAYWRAAAGRVPAGCAAAANAMAFAEQRYLVTDILRRYTHPMYTKTPSPPGEPPALVTGTLRRSVRPVLAPPAVRTTASLAPHTVYARIQETGGDIYPVRAKYLRWFSVTPQGQGFGYVPRSLRRTVPKGMAIYPVFAKHVHLPERPYMLPGRNDLVANGTFRRVADAAFQGTVWG